MTCSEKCQLGLCSYDCEHIPDGFCENIVEVQEKEIKRLEQEIQYLTECDIDSQEENWKWQKLLLIKRDKKHQEEIERLNNIIKEAINYIKEARGIANERINYCYNNNDKKQLESWQEIFDTLQGIDENE